MSLSARGSQRMRLNVLRVSLVALLLPGALMLAPSPVSAHTTHAARPLSPPPNHFVVTATAADELYGDPIVINNPVTNNQPNLALFVTPNFDPRGVCGCLYENWTPAVGYAGGWNAWMIYSRDGSTIPLGSTFNVLAVPQGTSVFMQIANASNISGNSTYIDNPLTNGHPNALLLVQSGNVGRFDPIGVWYDSYLQKWTIFYEDGALMDTAFNFYVMVGASASGYGTEFTQTATPSTTSGDSTFLNSSTTNWNPNAFVSVTPNWNPGGFCGCVYDLAALGVWYEKDRLPAAWAGFNEDTSSMPSGASFNVLALGN